AHTQKTIVAHKLTNKKDRIVVDIIQFHHVVNQSCREATAIVENHLLTFHGAVGSQETNYLINANALLKVFIGFIEHLVKLLQVLKSSLRTLNLAFFVVAAVFAVQVQCKIADGTLQSHANLIVGVASVDDNANFDSTSVCIIVD